MRVIFSSSSNLPGGCAAVFNCSLFAFPAFAAGECLKYKTVPSLKIKVPAFSVSVVQPDRPMDLLHGNVVATFAEEYEIEYGAAKIGDNGAPPETRRGGGWCIFIEGLAVEMGYTGFVVQIDRRHAPGSCEFDGIIEHEDEHINAHLSVVEDRQKDIRKAIAAAANNVLPVFVPDEDGIDGAMNDLEAELQNRPEVKLLRQKLAAEMEIRNKKIDMNDRGGRIRGCALLQ